MDSRGFHYSLDPVLKQATWQLDAAKLALGRACAALAQEQARQTKLDADYAGAARELSTDDGGVIDLARRRHALRYLGQMRTHLEEGKRQLERSVAARNEALEALNAAHRAMELLDQHRADMRRAYAAERARRAGAAQDEDWTARRAWRAAAVAMTDQEASPR
ncbi:flagellar export protein FliJ [Cupriavidus sp. 30B13]|uniref:flagellar export protein FliJ n=1 Tax=Cupriavidus sp. 30B13 TaxID=3384241 RepID=UPI003B9095C6